VLAIGRHRLGRQSLVGAKTGQMRGKVERAAHIGGATGGEKIVEAGKRVFVDGRQFGEARVLAPVARQERERDGGGAGGLRHLLGAVAPIIESAEKPHHHAAGARDHLLDIKIDRHRVAELGEIDEAQRRQRTACGLPAGRRRGKVAVAEGKEYEVGGGVPEIDGGPGLVQGTGLANEQMHGASPGSRLRWPRGRARSRR
jgi:hypothetical protein